MDEILGPVFSAADVRWDAHIATLTDFWSWQLLGEPAAGSEPVEAVFTTPPPESDTPQL